MLLREPGADKWIIRTVGHDFFSFMKLIPSVQRKEAMCCSPSSSSPVADSSHASVSELKREVSLELPSNISQKTIDSPEKSGVQRDS